jgi:hypothetical protein
MAARELGKKLAKIEPVWLREPSRGVPEIYSKLTFFHECRAT